MNNINSFSPINFTPLKSSSNHKKTSLEAPVHKKNSFGPFLMILSAFIFTISLSYSYMNFSSKSFDTRSRASESVGKQDIKVGKLNVKPELIAQWKKINDNAPLNPTTVSATALYKGKKTILKSEESYPIDEINFTWSGEQIKEPETKIIGYYVYFGPNNLEVPFPNENWMASVNPRFSGVKVDTNTYTGKITMKGIPYYLYVTVITDSKNDSYKYGFIRLEGYKSLPAQKLFTITNK